MKLTREQIRSLQFGDKFYRTGKTDRHIKSFIFCGFHPYAKGVCGIIAQHTSNVHDLVFIATHYSKGEESTTFEQYEYFMDYEEAKVRFIEFMEEDLASIKEIYSPN